MKSKESGPRSWRLGLRRTVADELRQTVAGSGESLDLPNYHHHALAAAGACAAIAQRIL